MMHTVLVAHDKEIPNTATARQLIEFGVALRHKVLRAIDPDPPGGRKSGSVSPVDTPELALYVFWSFQAHQGHGCGVAGYVIYQLITGSRYTGDYYTGARIIEDLRQAVFASGGSSAIGPLKTSRDYDDFFAEAMALQIQSARDRSLDHPSVLRLGDFTNADSVPEALISMAFGLSPLQTPEDARTGLLRILAESPGRALARSVEGKLAGALPIPDGSPEATAPALVLVQCIRLERGLQGSSIHFLAMLSGELRSSSESLARRLMPTASSPLASNPILSLIRRLEDEGALHV